MRQIFLLLLAAAGIGLADTEASAASRILFHCEGPYLYQYGRTVKDHDIVAADGGWHCFYIRGTEGVTGTSSEVALGHAFSRDLRHWEIKSPALVVGTSGFDQRNVWAPDLAVIPGTSTWTMFYTGVDASFLQRSGRANSPDLWSWSKVTPVVTIEPDSTIYMWSPDLEVPQLSAFRDPFYFEDGGQHHLLHTALLIDPALPQGRRGAVHHLVSDDFETWTDAGPLALNNNFTRGQWREIESIQLIQAAGKWHLFFTFFGVEGVQWVSSDQRDSGWNLAQAISIDPGIGPEVTHIGGDDWLLTRHSAGLYGERAPNAGDLFYVLRADTLRFDPDTGVPFVVPTNALDFDFPHRTGTAFEANPTFGDNPVHRGWPRANPIGNGYISSREFYAGPLSAIGYPGYEHGVEPVGTMLSREFVIAEDDSLLTLRVGGADDPLCTVSLVELDSIGPAVTDTIIHHTTTGGGRDALGLVYWDVTGLRGRTLRIRAIDASTTGWIEFDDVRVIADSGVPVAAPSAVHAGGRLLHNHPNPFNPRTTIAWRLETPAVVHLELFDLQGRRIRSEELGRHDSGDGAWTWDGTDQRGNSVGSGVYLVRLRLDGNASDARKLTLIR